MLRQERSQLQITQPATCGFDVAGGAAWRCSFSSHDGSTGSLSNAMDRAT
jgi:hypothetical protein